MARLLAVWVVLVLAPSGAFAQDAARPQMPRADVAGTVGWLHSALDGGNGVPDGLPDDDWSHRRGTIGATAGVYWTEHLKTEVMAETSNGTTLWSAEPFIVGGQLLYRSAEHTIRDTRVSIGQFYQFGHNRWVHPSVGAGVTIRHRTLTSIYYPAVFYDGRQPIHVADYERPQAEATVEPAAFAAVALKAYVTRRAFFRTDTQVDFRDGVRDVNARIGFGVDF
jgi:hypothetical protein